MDRGDGFIQGGFSDREIDEGEERGGEGSRMGQEDSDCMEKLVAEATADLRRVYRPREMRQKRSANEEWTLLVIRENRATVGRVELSCREGVAQVRGLAVDRGHRRQGFARRLMDVCEAEARRAGASVLRLVTIKETGNQGLFERMGFVVTGEKPSVDYEGTDGERVHEIELEKKI